MPKFSVYQQERNDGGSRIGVSFDDESDWQVFEPGPTDDDPTLRWYVDVRGEGDGVPESADDLYEWLRSLEMTDLIRREVTEFAARLATGIDQGAIPVRHIVANPPPGVRLSLVTSAVRRVDALEIADIVRRFGEDWPDLLERLSSVPQLA
jgi:hypothetical protein